MGDEIPILGVVMSPFSLPVMQLGFDRYLDLVYQAPFLLERLLRINEEFCVEWANAQLDAGATAICYFDPVSSPTIVPPELYRAYGLPAQKRAIARFKGAAAVHFASGRCLPIIDDVAKSGSLGICVSASEDLGEIKAAPGGGFILSDNHGEIPYQVPEEILIAIGAAVRRWGNYPLLRELARASLRPRFGLEPPPMADKPKTLKLIVCRMLMRETEAAVAAEGFADVVVESYASDCGHTGRHEPYRKLEAELRLGEGDAIHIAGSCVSPKERMAPSNGRISGAESCFNLFAEAQVIDGLLKEGCYLLTPGWLKSWRARLSDWGFDKETARSFFAESASSLALLDTGVDSGSAADLAEFAEYIDRPSRSIGVGLERYRSLLKAIVQGWRLEAMGRELG
jgi:hypothetical protein